MSSEGKCMGLIGSRRAIDGKGSIQKFISDEEGNLHIQVFAKNVNIS